MFVVTKSKGLANAGPFSVFFATKSSQLSDGFKLILIAADNCTSGQWLYSKNTFFERFVCNDADFLYLCKQNDKLLWKEENIP